MFTFTQSFPHRLTLNPVHIPLPVGHERGAMSTRCGASDLGNLLVLWDRSIGPQINWLHVRAIRLTWRCRGAERAVNRLFNSPGHRPGGHSSSSSLRFIFFPSLPPLLSPHSIVLLHWLHFSQCGYSRRTSAYRNIARRDCVCARVCVYRGEILANEPVLCALSSSTVSILSKWSLGMQYTHPASLPIPSSLYFSSCVCVPVLSLCVCLSLCFSHCLCLFIPFAFPFHLQTEAVNEYVGLGGGLIWKRTQTRFRKVGGLQICISPARSLPLLHVAQLEQINNNFVFSFRRLPCIDDANDLACRTSALHFYTLHSRVSVTLW